MGLNKGETSYIEIDGEEHMVGNIDCDVGWCQGNTGFPAKHKDCGGLIHAEFGDESFDGYWLYKKCDKCGKTDIDEDDFE